MTTIQSSLVSKQIFQSIQQEQEEMYANMSQAEFDSYLDKQILSTNLFIKACNVKQPQVQSVQRRPGILTFFFNSFSRN